MLDETLVLEAQEGETSIAADENKLHDFNVNEYDEYIAKLPEDAQEPLRELLSSRRPGWQMRARWLVRAKKGFESYERNMQMLIERLSTPARPRGRAAVYGKLPPRDFTRVFLTRMTLAQLRELAETKNVSYDSFMKNHDRDGLIESILDEMLES